MYKGVKGLTLEQQMISALPDVRHHRLTEADQFMVLASDGVWNTMSSEAVVAQIRQHLAAHIPLASICSAICDMCMSQSPYSYSGDGLDNETVVIVLFNGDGVVLEPDYMTTTKC